VDGSVREGVELKPAEKPKEETPIYEPSPETVERYDSASVEKQTQAESENEGFEMEDFPDAEKSASFVNFLTTLASQAAASLGAMPSPATGQRAVDLETGSILLIFWRCCAKKPLAICTRRSSACSMVCLPTCGCSLSL
jgi:hypothetical protein